MLKWLFPLLLSLMVITSCSTNDAELRWFATADEAIQDGIQIEGLTKGDVLDKIEKDGETLVVYKISLPDGIGLGIASLAKAEGKFAWYRANNPVIVQDANQKPVSVVKTTITTESKKSFMVHLGATKVPNQTIVTDKGVVSPTIDNSSGLFYYFE
ncbi:hypothetical protein ACFYU8_17950 [Brevibacillus sp. NPDC003359]|uniref:hypothetical protein n=1 Tax=unclassified Brevibacillus TaxID=2684853 RepID=UPI0036C64326